jgi:glycosyltransferase involved in cell wall biosynthesis
VLAARVGVAPNCYLEPATTKVADWLRQIDIFVLPSLSEALSNSLMEAMACGCCVVASRVGGNPELIDDGKNGFLFNVGDADDLALRLKTLIIDDTMRRKFAAAGRETILNQFSRTASVNRMASIYTDLYKS